MPFTSGSKHLRRDIIKARRLWLIYNDLTLLVSFFKISLSNMAISLKLNQKTSDHSICFYLEGQFFKDTVSEIKKFGSERDT